MNDLSRFPEEAWELLHFSGAEDVPEGTDLSEEMIPTHPVSGTYACWAVYHPANLVTEDFPTPTMTVSDGPMQMSVWYIKAPVRPSSRGYEKAINKWKQVITALTYELDGKEAPKVPNPEVLPQDLFTWTGKTMMMKNFVDHLKRYKKFDHNMHPDFLEEGGMSKTAAQTAARKTNFAKAREAAKETHKRRTIERSEKVMALVAEGLSDEQLAEALGIAVASIPTTVLRARSTLKLNQSELSAPKPEEKSDKSLTLEQLVAMADAA